MFWPSATSTALSVTIRHSKTASAQLVAVSLCPQVCDPWPNADAKLCSRVCGRSGIHKRLKALHFHVPLVVLT